MNTEIERLEQKMLEMAKRNGFALAEWCGGGCYRRLRIGPHQVFPEICLVQAQNGEIGMNWGGSSGWASPILANDLAKGLQKVAATAKQLERLRQELLALGAKRG